MIDKTAFPVHHLLTSFQLPLIIMSLDEWALVTLTGLDRFKYLQGQITSDINELQTDQHVLCAHCDGRGKMWCPLRLFHRGESLAFIERQSLVSTQLAELKKYAVFSKVSITQDEHAVLLGIAGYQARTVLASVFNTVPDAKHPVIQHQDSTVLHFSLPSERFLLVTGREQAESLRSKTGGNAADYDSQQWLALDIAAGYPIIDAINSGVFIPQAVNLQALAGISFTKGCYVGQEMVARAKYRGANKRALYWLVGTASRIPQAGEDLECQLDANWRRTGKVLAASQLQDNRLWVQAVLNNDLPPDTVLRVREDNHSTLTIQPLPYTLEETK